MAAGEEGLSEGDSWPCKPFVFDGARRYTTSLRSKSAAYSCNIIKSGVITIDEGVVKLVAGMNAVCVKTEGLNALIFIDRAITPKEVWVPKDYLDISAKIVPHKGKINRRK